MNEAVNEDFSLLFFSAAGEKVSPTAGALLPPSGTSTHFRL